MTNAEKMQALIDARQKINLIRADIQFELPLANEMLIRANQHIHDQIAELEREQWLQAELLEVEG